MSRLMYEYPLRPSILVAPLHPISEEESRARCDAIVDACGELYRTQSFRDISIGDIAGKLAFGRANIYNYFQSKEEIFLALLEREYDMWAADLEELTNSFAEGGRPGEDGALAEGAGSTSDAALADGIAKSLAARSQLLRLTSMNLYDMEENSRPENLVAFKRAYLHAANALRALVGTAKGWGPERTDRFVFGFLPFTYGLFPYACPTEKQVAAMREVGMPLPGLDIYGLALPVIESLLR